MRHRTRATWAKAILAGLGSVTLAAGLALAEETKSDGTATPPPAASDQTPQTSPTSTSAPDAGKPVPIPSATESQAAAGQGADAVGRVRDEGKKLDAKADQKATAAIEAAAKDAEKSVATDGDQKIAERLGAEFGMPAEALIAEKNELKTGWGQLMLAHALVANSTAEVSTRQIFDLRNEGMSWAQIASGMGLRLGEVVSAAKSEAKVARGLEKPDGKVAVVHGEGSKSGLSANPAGTPAAKKSASAKEAPGKAASAKEASAAPEAHGSKDATPKAEAQSANPGSPSEGAPGKSGK